jgi:hypothetical protein
VYAHGKGPFGHFAVRIHTAKPPTWRTPVQPGSWSGCCPRPLPCELALGRTAKPPGQRTATTTARQRIGTRQCIDARQSPQRTAKGPRTAKVSAHGNVHTHGKEAMRTAMLARHGKGLCRAYMAPRTAKISLPFVTLSWALCRASTHGKDVAVRFLPFAVRTPRTAKPLFPVVHLRLYQLLYGQFAAISCRPENIICATTAREKLIKPCFSTTITCYSSTRTSLTHVHQSIILSRSSIFAQKAPLRFSSPSPIDSPQQESVCHLQFQL